LPGLASLAAQETLESIFLEGFAAPTLVDKLLELTVHAPTLTDAQKGKIGLALGRVDKCLADGASDHLQVHAPRLGAV
jgi:hypothetical protein